MNLSEVNLSGANLSGAELSSAHRAEANLFRAPLFSGRTSARRTSPRRTSPGVPAPYAYNQVYVAPQAFAYYDAPRGYYQDCWSDWGRRALNSQPEPSSSPQG